MLSTPLPSAPPSGGRRGLVERLESVPVPRVLGLGRDTSLLFWTWCLWGAGLGLWSYLWPVYLSSLGADAFQIGLIVSIPFLIGTLGYLPGGFIAQLGHHKWQLAGTHVMPVAAVATFGLAHSWWQVVPGVVFLHLVAIFGPAVNSYIAQTADDEGIPVPRVFTLTGAGLFGAMTVTPPLGGLIADRYGITAVFPLVSLVYGASVAGMFLLRSRPMPGAPVEGGVPAARRRSALAAGASAYRSLLGTPRVRLLLLAALLVQAGMHVALSFGPLYLGDVYGYDAARIGWVGSAASAGTVTLLLTMERFRRRSGQVITMGVATAAMAAHFGLTILSPAPALQLAGFFCRGGFQTVATLTTVVLTETISRSQLAPGIALLATVNGFAAMLAPPLGGWLYARSPDAPFVAGILLLATTWPLVARVFRPAPAPAPESSPLPASGTV